MVQNPKREGKVYKKWNPVSQVCIYAQWIAIPVSKLPDVFFRSTKLNDAKTKKKKGGQTQK